MASTTLERLEKASSLLRNVVLIAGALVTSGLFLAERWRDPVSVHVNTIYLSSGQDDQRMRFMAPDAAGSGIVAPIGTVSEVFIQNNGELPVALEVRTPIGRKSADAKWPLFSLINPSPLCALLPAELQGPNNGYLAPDSSGGAYGGLVVQRFPPGCTLVLEIVSAKVDESTRLMSGNVEVFVDGRPAEVQRAIQLYGRLGRYASAVEEGGPFDKFMLLVLPVLVLIFSVTLAVQMIVRRGGSTPPSAPLPPAQTPATLA